MSDEAKNEKAFAGEPARRQSAIAMDEGVIGCLDAAGRTRFLLRTELPAARRWSLRMTGRDAASIVSVGGFDIGQRINEARMADLPGGAERLSVRLGPDEWLLIAASEPHGAEPMLPPE